MQKKSGGETETMPERGLGDVVYVGAKALVSAVPWLGGPAAEILGYAIIQPLEKRRKEWLEKLAERLKTVEEHTRAFEIEQLSVNESFVTTCLQASQIAVRNHDSEKLRALRNAVVNSALPGAPEDALQTVFLSFVDTFSTWHLALLKFVDQPIADSAGDVAYRSTVRNLINEAFPALERRQGLIDQILRDLDMRGLLRDENLHDRVPTVLNLGRILADIAITPLGKEFLSFIAEPDSDEAEDAE